ncbi:hypothetical protein ABB37_03187 [Leptomonas pyrrhocoris]|uniref:RIIa domain-containing protein n=1 Tax=Leptomonas pyrrhocoris TaxID=157538 RepID=A0A0N0DWN6_LEPPY|nr:hypothetical protein ABB37_03187 [Leptomonas pyrrhocoris]KPA82011.1 hypothetical protein ABB37_03187 [Leptomonas pyrrhocoris]|eukprot:XP_015660450.1 hypothetical protein ABB37_03187 [Leptomonas pyrrhocoris]
MSNLDPTGLMAAPTLSEAVSAVFSEQEREALKSNLQTEQVAQAKYLRAHPEVSRSLQEGLRRVLQTQPDNPVAALTEYFTSAEFMNYECKGESAA